ncbi:odorant receptor 43a-like isoform X1 [Anopheles albimanus]|uniref:odorant receptor 43a-like isoform X1 n=1 Tax=Anopheles albimanus TaxID=7167 RepID=UPI00163E490F|nr:odorant receptor 43a-like isoform X1 [Anopheles albimanus]
MLKILLLVFCRSFYNLDIRHNLVHYSIYNFVIGLLTFTSALSLCTKDVVDFGNIRTAALMFEILAMQIRELPRHISQQNLKTIIKSHQTVLQCFRKLQQSLSLALLIQLAFFSAVWCFILVYILLMGLSAEVLNLCIFLIIITIETYSYCSLCTELTTKGNEILLALQELPWYEQPVKIQKQILLMIRRSQVPTVLKAGKLVAVNIALFSSMIQKTYSLYLVMKDIF